MKKDLDLYKKYLEMHEQKLANGGQAFKSQNVGQNPFQFLNSYDQSQGVNIPVMSVGPNAQPQSPSGSSSPNPLAGIKSLLPSAGSLPGVGGSAAGDATFAGPDMGASSLDSLTQVAAYDGGLIHNMADGGKVQSNDSFLSDLQDKLRQVFSSPPQIPKSSPTLEDKYKKVRDQNTDISSGKKSVVDEEVYFDGGISGSTHKAQYDDGGEVQSSGPSLAEQYQKMYPGLSSNQIAAKISSLPAAAQQSTTSQAIYNQKMSNGGKVEHDRKNLLELKDAFDKFLDEESKEKYANGGKVGSGERFAKLENKLSHQKGVTDPGALAASIGRKKYGTKKMNKMAQAHMADGGEVDFNPSDHKAIVIIDPYQPVPSPTPVQDPNKKELGDYFADGGKATLDDNSDASIAAKAQKYGWSDAEVNRIKSMRDSAPPELDQSQQMQQNQPVQPIGNPVVDPSKAQQIAQAFMAKGGMVQHFDGSDGSVVLPEQDPVLPDLSPEEIASREEELKQLKSKGAEQVPVQGEEQNITGALPSKESDVEESEDPSDKELEEEMANEDFKAGEDGDDSDELVNNSDEKNDEDQTQEERKLQGMSDDSDQSSKDQAAGLQVSPDIQKVVDSQKSGSDDLKAAQKQRDMAIANQQMAKGAALLGAGIAGRGGSKVDPSLALKVIGEGDQYVNLPVQKYQEQIANQQNDPNSPMSKMSRQYFQSKGFQVPDSASASDLKMIAPNYQKDLGYQTALQKVLSQNASREKIAKNNLQGRKDIATSNQNARMEQQKLANQGKIAAAKTSQDNKSAATEQKAEQAMTNARSKPALAMAQRNLVSIANMQKMFEDYGNPDKWTPAQVGAWNTEKAKVAQGGSPTEGMINELSNPTYGNQMAKLIQKFTSTPTGAGQGKFIDQDRKYIDGLHDVSQNVIKGNVGDVLKSYQNGLSPDAYKNAVYRHSDALGLYNQNQEKGIAAVMAAKGLARQDAIKALVQQGVLKDVNY